LTSWGARLLATGALSACSGCAALAGSAEHGQALPAHGEASHAGVAMPDPRRTPGAIFPGASRAEICRPGYARSVRHVSLATKRSTYARDHVAYRGGADVVDHLIPLSLGGSNDPENLWIQPTTTAGNAHDKDGLEYALWKATCQQRRELHAAQEAIASDWYGTWTAMGRPRAPHIPGD